MVDYIRRQMSVSLLLYPDSDRNEANLEQLKKVWPDVDFYVFTRDMAKPAVRHPFYYKWLGKAKASLTRKMRRQLLASETQDLVRKKSTLWKSMPGLLDSAYMDYVVEVAGRGFDIIQVEFYELIELGYLLPRDVPTVFVHHEIRFIRNQNEMVLFEDVTPQEELLKLEMARAGAFAVRDRGMGRPTKKERRDYIDECGNASVAERLCEVMAQKTGLACRSTVLGHIQRGGEPCAYDKFISTEIGAYGAYLAETGKYGVTVCVRGNKLSYSVLVDIAGRTKRVPVDGQQIGLAKAAGVYFGD